VAARTGAHLRIVGADPLSVRWLARRERLSLDSVDLLGGLSEDELTRELAEASLLAAPSLGGESFGMVLTRAFATATPVVASDIEGYSHVAGPETGILVPPGDPDRLAAALIELLEDEPRRRRLGEAARTVAERYSWNTIAQRLVAIYEDLVNGRSVSRVAA
jgi:phosphatidylinositol alpha-mannosyltransferase